MKKITNPSYSVLLGLVLCLGVFNAAASASLVFEDGATHSVPTGNVGNVYISLGSVVNMDDENTIMGRAYVSDDSTFNVSAGTVDMIRSYDTSVVEITGGFVTDLFAVGASVVNIYGEFDSYGEVLDDFGDITGLIGGQTQTISFIRDCEARIFLHDVNIPEPASIVALGLGGLLFRRRQKS